MKFGIASSDIGVVEDPNDPEAPPRTFPGGSFWYRYSQPLHHLGLRERTVVGGLRRGANGNLGIESWETGEIHDDCDVLLLQRCMWAGLPEAILRARANGQIVINDIDDWFDALPPSNIAFKATQAGSNPTLNREIYKQAIGASSAIICSTPFLVEQYSRFRRPIHLWRNSIDFDSFPFRREQQDKPMIGWLGNLGYRAKDTETLKGIIGPFLEAHDLIFNHVGHLPGNDAIVPLAPRIGVPPERMMLTPAISFIVLSLELYQQFDIGLVPLEDIRFNDAKSCLKGMEYVASGIPFVAAPSAEYRWLLEHGIGRVAKRPLDWKKHMTALLDVDARREEAERNLALMRPLVDIENTKQAWLDIILNTDP